MSSSASITVEKATDWDDDGWTSVPNRITRDPELTALEKVAFSWFASHSKEFKFDLDDMAEDMAEGRNQCRDAVRGLERRGLLVRAKIHAPGTGRIVGTKYKLHHTPVPAEERTFVASTAKRRSSFPKKPRSAPAPERAGFGADDDDVQQENGRSAPAPDGPGAGGPGAGQPGAGRTGSPSKEEKTTREDQGGAPKQEPDVARDATAETPPPEPPRADWQKPETCLCSPHLAAVQADLGFDVPKCPQCQRVREWGEAKRAEAARAVTDRGALCSWHDAMGWVVDPATGHPFDGPAVRCDHVKTSPEAVAAARAVPTVTVESSSAEARARAREVARCKPSARTASRRARAEVSI